MSTRVDSHEDVIQCQESMHHHRKSAENWHCHTLANTFKDSQYVKMQPELTHRHTQRGDESTWSAPCFWR